jgi:hypothetical protein
MHDDLKHFEKRMTRDLQSFQEHGRVIERKKAVPARAGVRGLEVTLLVRIKKRSFLDERFTTVVDTISKLEATIEARKRATDAGWPYVAYTIDIVPVK